MAGAPVNVRISQENYDRLCELCAKTRMPKGRIVDDAMSLFFTPPEERSDRVILRRFDLLENKLERAEGNLSFNGDMMAEFIWRWLAEQRSDPAAESPALARDRLKQFEQFSEDVLARSQSSGPD